LKMH